MGLLLEIAAPIVAAFAGFLLAAALSAGATEDAYRAGYLAGIRAVAQMGQLLPGARSASAGAGPVRASGRMPTSRRRRRRLVGCEITRHAVEAYLARHPEARPLGAVDHLEELCRGARFARRRATGEEEWRAAGCRLIVHRIARRPPILLTVLPPEGVRS